MSSLKFAVNVVKNILESKNKFALFYFLKNHKRTQREWGKKRGIRSIARIESVYTLSSKWKSQISPLVNFWGFPQSPSFCFDVLKYFFAWQKERAKCDEKILTGEGRFFCHNERRGKKKIKKRERKYLTLGVSVLGWLAERRKERSGVRFSQPPKGTDMGPNVQIFFLFFSFWQWRRLKREDWFFVTWTDCVKEQIRESNNRRSRHVFVAPIFKIDFVATSFFKKTF